MTRRTIQNVLSGSFPKWTVIFSYKIFLRVAAACIFLIRRSVSGTVILFLGFSKCLRFLPKTPEIEASGSKAAAAGATKGSETMAARARGPMIPNIDSNPVIPFVILTVSIKGNVRKRVNITCMHEN